MGFLTIEDMVGSVEVLVFPRQYEMHAPLLTEDAKVFIHGIVSAEEEKDAKVICEKVVSFEQYPRKIWIKFADRAACEALEERLEALFAPSDGIDEIVYYLEAEKQMKTLAKNKTVKADAVLLDAIKALVGEANVKVV